MSPKKKAARAGASSRPHRPRGRAGTAGRPVDRPDGERSGPPVVGIGASAGGLQALASLFGAMPSGTGLAFVVVVHLDPTHESLLPELLGRRTTLAVEPVRDLQRVEADHVYVIPPNRYLTIESGRLHLMEPSEGRGPRAAIDHFFRSLAADQQEQSIGIVLSGTGTGGTLGLRAIKSEGGTVLVQSPETAGYDGMPRSAIETGLADEVLAPEEMPQVLVKYAHRPHRAPVSRPEARPSTAESDVTAIVTLLRARTKRDFRGYKRGTLRRRIERRMALEQIAGLPAYLDYLRTHPGEADQLSKDLLIGVTSFFRDPQAFAELAAKVLAKLVAERERDDAPIRIWVPGCATGEEAYSLAMLVAEQAAAAQVPCRVQIFGTDIDESALRVARTGLYPDSIALDVTPERLRRFFTKEGHNFRIAQSLRESVVFAVQNLVSNPPFSKLDLVSCRNVLIYLDPEMQRRVVSLFHFALLPGGHLFLGSAETPGADDELFAPVSKRSHIYRRMGLARRPVVTFPLGEQPSGVLGAQVTTAAMAEPDLETLLRQELLSYLAPSAVLITRTGQIRRFYGRMERYLSLPEGEPNLDVLRLAHEPLKPALRAALHEAVRHNRVATAEAVRVRTADGQATIRATVRPLAASSAGEGLLLAIFEEMPSATRASARADSQKRRDLVRQLEAELRITKEEQRSLVEQLESGNEELKTANEEVLSMNEELQSTNEELETSKEELQSMNEELSTVNAQLQEKVQELTTVNDDLANLLAATDIATLFVEADLRVKRFTTAATRLFNLIPSDVGRPLSHITNNLIEMDLAGDAEAVLRTLQTSEKEVQARDGHDYIVRVLPYRSAGQVVQGVVVTFSDVTTLKASERRLFNSRRRQEEIARLGQEALAGAAVTTLMEQCVRTVAGVLGVELVEVLEYRSETNDLVRRAGVGMDPASLGAPAATASPDSPEGAAYVARATTVFADLSADVRFAEATLVTQLAMRSGVLVLIRHGRRTLGDRRRLLDGGGTRSRRPRT